MAKPGRKSSYTPEMAAAICEGLASGKTLISICSQPGFPCCASVFLWLTKYPEFSEMYARARESQADYYAAEIVEIADTPREGVKEKRKQVGWQCPACGREAKWRGTLWYHFDDWSIICEGVSKPDSVCEVEVQTGDMVERAKLQIDVRKHLMGKLNPKRYGDRLELAGDPNAPLQISLAEAIRQRRQKLRAGDLENRNQSECR